MEVALYSLGSSVREHLRAPAPDACDHKTNTVAMSLQLDGAKQRGALGTWPAAQPQLPVVATGRPLAVALTGKPSGSASRCKGQATHRSSPAAGGRCGTAAPVRGAGPTGQTGRTHRCPCGGTLNAGRQSQGRCEYERTRVQHPRREDSEDSKPISAVPCHPGPCTK